MAPQSSPGWAELKSDATKIRAAEDDEKNFFTGDQHTAPYRQIQIQRRRLPMQQHTQRFLDAFQSEQKVTLLTAETGSGKSTQVPAIALHAYGKSSRAVVAVLQPRRLATITNAKRVSQELDATCGKLVGYRVRNDEQVEAGTSRIVSLTDGFVLAQAVSDPTLSQYRCIILDEAHERTIATDFVMALIKMSPRTDIKCVIMSATLSSSIFRDYMPDATVVEVPGRGFPVRISYLPEDHASDDEMANMVEAIMHIHLFENIGDILVFVAGTGEIDRLKAALDVEVDRYEKSCPGQLGQLHILPLHGKQDQNSQDKALLPIRASETMIHSRKVVIGTNVMETSLTIDGADFVVDSGYFNQPVYNPRTGATYLEKVRISKASAKQRTGRSGRTGPGRCYRMYTQSEFESSFPDTAYPAILATEPTDIVMRTINLSQPKPPFPRVSPFNFELIQPQTPDLLHKGYEEMHWLKFYRDTLRILEPDGRTAQKLTLEPKLARVLLASTQPELACSAQVASIIAVLEATSQKSLWLPVDKDKESKKQGLQKSWSHFLGEPLQLLNIYDSYRNKRQKDPSDLKDWCRGELLDLNVLRKADTAREGLIRRMKANDLPILRQSYTTPDGEPNPDYYTVIRRAFAEGFFMNAAIHDPDQYRPNLYTNLAGTQAFTQPWFDPSTNLRPKNKEWIVYMEYKPMVKKGPYFTMVTVVNPVWLIQASPDYFDPEGLLPGRAKDSLLKVFRDATKFSHDYLRGMRSIEKRMKQ